MSAVNYFDYCLIIYIYGARHLKADVVKEKKYSSKSKYSKFR